MARYQARAAATVVVALLCGLSTSAQGQRGAGADTPRLLIGVFRSSEKTTGSDIADELRTRVTEEVPVRLVWVIPKQDVIATLEASGYPTNDTLSLSDAFQLGRQVRADEFLFGSVTRTATGFSADADVILARDMSLLQPLGSFEGKHLDDVVSKIVKAYAAAHRVYDNEKRCRRAQIDKKSVDAMKEVTNGLQTYPRSTLLRYCELNVLTDQARPPAELLAVANEILAIDPKSKIALAATIDAYDKLGDKQKKIDALMRVLAADPTNAKLILGVANELAAAGQYRQAKEILEKALTDTPGDIAMVKLYWLVLGATNDMGKMAAVGEEMVKMDSSLADTTFFSRLISAYIADSNTAKAAEAAARATGKFPTIANFWIRRGQLELKAGQTQQAIGSLRRALELDPKDAVARRLVLQGYLDLQQYDSAFVAMREALKVGEDRDVIAGAAAAIANRLYKAATTPPQEQRVVADFQRVFPYAKFADSLAVKPLTRQTAKYLIGMAGFNMMHISANEALKNKSCDMAKMALDALVETEMNLPAGGKIAPAVVSELLPSLPKYRESIESQIKQFCK